MKTTWSDALAALHSGLVGMLYPTYKMIPQPSGMERALMHEATFATVDGVVKIVEYGNETVDPNPKRCNSGYSDSVIEGLTDAGYVTSHYGEFDGYPALMFTPAGVEFVIGEFGPPVRDIHYVADDVIQIRKA